MNYQAVKEPLPDSRTMPLRIEGRFNKRRKTKPTIGERTLALYVLIATSPVLILLALFIAFGGQNPIFCQDRVGFMGRLFSIYKFRTIPDEGWKAAERRACESRVAAIRLFIFKRVSAVLRSTGLDELPQFANIVKGDMQIIGPRPLIVDDFIALPERRLERCAVPPGITGLAQINGGQHLDPTSKLALDLYVIDHQSFGIVCKIVTRTVLRIVRGTSATAEASAHDLKLARHHMTFKIRSEDIEIRVAPGRAGGVCGFRDQAAS
ncbi:sugar transferase [Thalassococcus sp. BH17M4-6]|uniref:sugar transferase n=1 Tax=Thalassococcus sp. BH17M4-6 TaxID=3413148 RepID=UPI003BC33F00